MNAFVPIEADGAQGSAAEQFGPGRLWSLLEMLEFNAAKFMRLMQVLDRSLETMDAHPGKIAERLRASACDTPANALKELCDGLKLTVSSKHTSYIRAARDGKSLSEAFRLVKSTIHAELDGRLFFEPDTKHQQYLKKDELFGREVFDAFPSANEDISEAGTCLALERGTACVMHLMRVCEAGLKQLARELGVGTQNDWGSYLREIDKKLTEKAKSSGARSELEQFYAESAASFDHVRRAWRNPTLHIERSYSLERAEEILQAVRSFMRHLSTHLREPSVFD